MAFDSNALVDSHCHVQSLPADEREAALDRARERGVEGFLLPAIRLSEAEELLDFCHRHEGVWCALGVHPHEASTWQDGDEERLRSLLTDPKAVAVGECGLDFHYDNSPREQQHEALRAQWALALDLGLPVVVHNRDSNQAMLDEVRRPEHRELQGVFHSFAGGLEMGRELVERDFYLGFTGMVTFRAADNVREVLPVVPPERLLVETDTPYLAPVPHRGQRNEPAYVVEIAQRVADELDEPLTDLTRRTTENFFRLFPKAAG
ncbi:MAG: TatD family hydrolase [Acidobacteriota bacterium]|nr:TatD family hydrolase [Acidobacteriota bacterium]